VSEINLDIDREVAKGRYSNLAVISHTKNEFLIDFALMQPHGPALVVARVLTSPRHAKAFLRSLAENIRRYEEAHGPIEEEDSFQGGPGTGWGRA